MASTEKGVGGAGAPTYAFSQLRLRWSADVQIRNEHFGAVAYHSKLQRLMLIESTVATKVADLLNGQELACQELAPLGYEGDALEQLLIQLYKAALLEIVDESDTSRVASVHFDESVLE